MTEHSVSERLKKSIIIYSALGILVVGLIVSLVGVTPLYISLKKDPERHLLFDVKTRTMAVEEYLSRVKDIAIQITSRTKAREKLEAYNRGDVGHEEMEKFLKPILRDALNRSPEAIGIARLDQKGIFTLQVGVPIPEEFWTAPNKDTREASIQGPVVIEGKSYLVARAPILNRQSIRVGTDIVLFKLSRLKQIVKDYSGMGKTGEAILGRVHDDKVQPLFSLRKDKDGTAKNIPKISPLGLAIDKAVDNDTGILSAEDSAGSPAVIAYGPIQGTNWGIIIKKDKQELFSAIRKQLYIISSSIIVLILLGTSGMVVLLRPLAGKILIHTGDLEREVQEKTLALRNELNERKRAQEELIRFAEKLQNSNKELEDFAYIASHDLQEPLRKVTAFGDRLTTKYDEVLGEQGRGYLERMQNATRRMQTLINDLLMYSRVTTKAQPFVPTDLSTVVNDVLSDLEIHIEQVKGRVDVGDLPVIDADPLQMRQLLQNLIGNALKFNKKDEAPVVKVRGMFSNGNGAAAENDHYQLIVEDCGIGFDEKFTDRIFGVFQRLHGRSEYEGTGIGLSVCKKIVERHGGSITAKSNPGEGARFIVALPVKHSDGGTNG